MSDSNSEGSVWFWKIFGGAIVGLVSLLTITLINTIISSNQQSKADILNSISEIRSDIRIINSDLISQKEKLSKIENNRYDEEVDQLRKKIDDVNMIVNNRTERIAAIEGLLATLKEQVVKEESSRSDLYKKILELENELKLIKSQSQSIQEDVEVKKTLLRDRL